VERDTHKDIIATALQYDAAKDTAPRVTAKGRGYVAEKIIELANQNGIPIKADPALVEILSQLDIDQHIPVELYKAVAEILAFVYSLNERYKGTN